MDGKEILERVEKLYAEMKPLMDHFGMKRTTIEERYLRSLQKQKELIKPRAGPRFKLPKL